MMYNHKEDKVHCERCGHLIEESLSVMMSDCSVVCVECLVEDIEEDITDECGQYFSDDDY